MDYLVRVAESYRWRTVRAAGREFVKGEPRLVREGDPGAAEILGCPLLVVEEVEEGPPSARGFAPPEEAGDEEDG